MTEQIRCGNCKHFVTPEKVLANKEKLSAELRNVIEMAELNFGLCRQAEIYRFFGARRLHDCQTFEKKGEPHENVEA